METRRRNVIMAAVALLLLLFAVVLVAPTFARWRHHGQVEEHAAFASPKVLSPHGAIGEHGGPLADLHLSAEQEKQIHSMMRETIQQEREKGPQSDGKVTIRIPIERIRSILTPEQRRILAEKEKKMKDYFATPGHTDTLTSPSQGSGGPMMYFHQGQ